MLGRRSEGVRSAAPQRRGLRRPGVQRQERLLGRRLRLAQGLRRGHAHHRAREAGALHLPLQRLLARRVRRPAGGGCPEVHLQGLRRVAQQSSQKLGGARVTEHYTLVGGRPKSSWASPNVDHFFPIWANIAQSLDDFHQSGPAFGQIWPVGQIRTETD